MPVSLTCSGCKATLKLRDDLAGKKVKCPRCATILLVPLPATDVVPPRAAPDARVREAPPPASRKPRPQRDDPDEDDDRDRKRNSGIRAGRDRNDEDDRPRKRNSDIRPDRERNRRRDEEDDLDEDDAPEVARVKYKPCPRCGARGAERVLWTAWGSFYGPALLTHVRCPDCSYCYNGKTGRSNTVPAVLFFTVPLIGILGILAGVLYLLMSRGYIKF